MRRTIATPALLASLCLGLVAEQSAQSTTFRPYTLRTQLLDSQIVFEGRIDRLFACPDATAFPRTCGQVTVSRFHKGQTSTGKVVILVPGGTRSDGSSVQVTGAPTLRAGDVILGATTVMPGSADTVALTNSETALVKRVTEGTTHLAANAQERKLVTLPLDACPQYGPKPFGVGEATPERADSLSGEAPASPPAPVTFMTWTQAQQAVAQGIAATAATGRPPAVIRGAN